MSGHVCVETPGTAVCFTCGRDMDPHDHRAQEVTYGAGPSAITVLECWRCCADWPCKVVKAISHNARLGRERRHAERMARHGQG